MKDQFELNGVTYEADADTLAALRSIMPAAKDSSDYSAVTAVMALGLKTGRIGRIRSKDERMQIAKTILGQLGGRQFMVMTGARNCFATQDGLQFSLPSNGRHPESNKTINRVRVDLTEMDDYTVSVHYVRRLSVTDIDQREGVYCDNLQEVFTDLTGLLTRGIK